MVGMALPLPLLAPAGGESGHTGAGRPKWQSQQTGAITLRLVRGLALVCYLNQ